MLFEMGARTAALDGFKAFMELGSGQATATLYQGTTPLAVFNLAVLPFGSAVNDALVLASTPIASVGTEVAGTVTRLVFVNQNSAEGLELTVSAPGAGGDVEASGALTVTAGATQYLNSFVLRMDKYGRLTAEASLSLS